MTVNPQERIRPEVPFPVRYLPTLQFTDQQTGWLYSWSHVQPYMFGIYPTVTAFLAREAPDMKLSFPAEGINVVSNMPVWADCAKVIQAHQRRCGQ